MYLNCLYDLQTSEQTKDLFRDIEVEKIFLNIIEIFNCNIRFWQNYLYPKMCDVAKSATILINPSALKLAFLQVYNYFLLLLTINSLF